MYTPIHGFEGYYVTKDGEIISKRKNKITKLKQIDNGKGYKSVTLYNNSIPKSLYVHRIVASAFLKNNENLPEVNHKNSIRSDNRVENLEWCTKKYNNLYSNTHLNSKKLNKKVLIIDLKKEVIISFNSKREAKRNGYYSNVTKNYISMEVV